MLYGEMQNEIRFESVYPPTMISKLNRKTDEGWSLDRERAPGRRIGIAGRAVQKKSAQRVANVQTDPDYLEFDPRTRSELDVPLLDDGRVIGVVGIESDLPSAFDEYDELALRGLAELAVIAIKNADRANQLSLTNTVAFMGAWGADVVHDVNREVGAIRRAVFMLQLQHHLVPDVVQRLQDIDAYAARLALAELPVQIAGANSSIGWDDAAALDAVLRSEAQALAAAHPSITFVRDFGCDTARVSIHEQWLRRLARHLIRNAIQAISADSVVRRIIVRTRIKESMAEVVVEDTGKGVRPDIRSSLFEQSIDQSGGGSGHGLLLVRFLAEQHGGYARLEWSEPGQGARFLFAVPLAEPKATTASKASTRR
jgi:signal transduction histidine kinase